MKGRTSDTINDKETPLRRGSCLWRHSTAMGRASPTDHPWPSMA